MITGRLLPLFLYLVTFGVCCFCLGCDGAAIPQGETDIDSFSVNHIIGGEETNYESWKGVVSVTNQNCYSCTATLIQPQLAITAAHCFYLTNTHDCTNDPSGTFVEGGANLMDPSSLITYTNAVEIVLHPDWTGHGGVDMALVKLAKPIVDVEYYSVRPTDPSLAVGDEGVIVGYGNQSKTDSASCYIHRAGEAKVITMGNSEATGPNGEKEWLEEYQMEIGDPAGICYGDSGGPFLTFRDNKWMLSAVHSALMFGDCLTTGGSREINVTTVRDWIDEEAYELTGIGLDDSPSDTNTTADGGPPDSGEEETSSQDGCECSTVPSNSSAGLLSVVLFLFV